MSSSSSTKENLVSSTRAFISDVVQGAPLSVLSSHFTSDTFHLCPTIFENGPPTPELPFLGVRFNGRKGVEQYFTLLSSQLGLDELLFPEEDMLVDEEKGVVACFGLGQFFVKETGKGWKEKVSYRLKWEEEGGKLVLSSYEIWAGVSDLLTCVTCTG